VFVGFCDLHDRYYLDNQNCSADYKKIRECILNKDFGRFDMYSRLW
jgi:hypothetical protein